MSHQLERALGLICFTVFALSFIARRTKGQSASPAENHRSSFSSRLASHLSPLASLLAGVVFIAAGAAALGPDPPRAVAALALMTVGLWFLVEGFGVSAGEIAPYALTALVFAVLLLVGKTVPPAWYGARHLARLSCGIANALSGGAVDFRPTFAGLGTTVLLLVFWCARWAFAEKRKWADLVLPVVFTLAAQAVYLVAAARLLAVLLPVVYSFEGKKAEEILWYQAALRRSVPWNFPAVLFLLNVPILLWGVGRCPVAAEVVRRPGHRVAALLGVVGAAVATWLLCRQPLRAPETPDKAIVFYKKGFLNWESPKFGQYGPLSPGMFGNLPRFVESLGLKSRMADAITSRALEGASALVIINLDHPLTSATIEAVWEFVRRGGALMVLADHTAYDESGRVFVNELLRPTAIAVHFDSADTPVGGWLHCYDFRRHPLTANLGDERNEPGIVVGASLEIRPPAYPVIVGRWGYEDRGNRFAPDHAYLGNMRFDADEPLGDAVLLAAQRLGRGKVLVFGDTSSFVNGIVVSTHKFVGRVFRWLVSTGGDPASAPIEAAALLLLVVSLVLLFVKGPPGRWACLFTAAAVVAVPAFTAWRQGRALESRWRAR